MQFRRAPKSNRFVTPLDVPEQAPQVNVQSELLWYNEHIAKCQNDPAYFMTHTFPWQDPSTRLCYESGLEAWQMEAAELMRDHLQASDRIFRLGIASGNNVGKTSFAAWTILFFLSTNPFSKVLVASSTGTNLHTRLWFEVDKWLRMSALTGFFEWKHSILQHRDHPTQWFALPQTWTREAPQGFAGVHENKVLIVFDEASSFPQVMWETAESCLTSKGAMWLAIGNPTEPRGPFRDIFPGGIHASAWTTMHVDATKCRRPDQEKLAEDIQRYGIDSDYVKVHILGLFPKLGMNQLIGENLLETACARVELGNPHAPIRIGVDVASIGMNKSVLLARKGRKLVETRVYPDDDEIVVCGYLEEMIREYKYIDSYMDKEVWPEVFIDGIGYGHTIGRILIEKGYKTINIVKGSESPSKPDEFHNLRAELYLKVRNWIKDYGCLDPRKDQELIAQLGQIKYLFDLDHRWQIESKEDMRSRGFASPDEADALSLTFAEGKKKGASVMQMRW